MMSILKAKKIFTTLYLATIKEVYDNFNNVLHESKFKNDISEMYGDKFLEEIEIDLKTFDPKIKSLLQKEIELKNQYTELTAGAKINFEQIFNVRCRR